MEPHCTVLGLFAGQRKEQFRSPHGKKRETAMKLITKAVLTAASALALSATTASAEIVCNDEGDCWHVREHHAYRPEFGVRVYPDAWRWGDADAHRYRWREHEGRGYWRRGAWIGF
jgi:hypothetical protein